MVTFASSDDDAFNLLPAVAGSIKDAQIKGNPLIMRSLLGYVAAGRAAQGGTQAFMDATKFLVANMLRSLSKKLEIEMLYGQMGYATVASNAAAVLTITTAEWAPGIWAGSVNMPIEIRDTTGATSKGEYSVTSVSMANQTVTINVSPGTLVAGDVIWHKGAYGNEFPGIHKILSQSTGLLFNIDVAVNDIFRGNVLTTTAELSFALLNKAVSRVVEKGQDGTLLALCNPRGWGDMLQEQAALRKYDSSYSAGKAENGSKSIVFHSQNGDIEIEPSIYVKQGHCFLLNLEDWMRIGSQDVSFERPGQKGEFFRDLENSAAYELRLYTDQALFCSAPGKSLIITGIVNEQA